MGGRRLRTPKMAAVELEWVPETLYNTAISAVVDSYGRARRRDIRSLPENIQFDVYYKVRAGSGALSEAGPGPGLRGREGRRAGPGEEGARACPRGERRAQGLVSYGAAGLRPEGRGAGTKACGAAAGGGGSGEAGPRGAAGAVSARGRREGAALGARLRDGWRRFPGVGGWGGEEVRSAGLCWGVEGLFFFLPFPPMLQKVMSVVEVSGSAVLLYL